MTITGGGVYRVLAPAAAIRDALAADGWSVVVLLPSTSLGQLYAGLAVAADLPDWFGANLDALWDVLTDLTGPTALVLERWTRLARAEPRDWPRLLTVLEERTRLEPAFALVLA